MTPSLFELAPSSALVAAATVLLDKPRRRREAEGDELVGIGLDVIAERQRLVRFVGRAILVVDGHRDAVLRRWSCEVVGSRARGCGEDRGPSRTTVDFQFDDDDDFFPPTTG